MADYDVIILGGGPGGYIAAERLAHGGKKVLLVEKNALGGTCLNVGCIPTKALLNSVKTYDHAKHSSQFGVTAENVSYDWSAIQDWKGKTVSTLVGGVSQMMRHLKVEVVNATGRLTSPTTVEVDGQTHNATDIIIATGSIPAMPPIPGAADNPSVLDSTGLLGIDHVPASLTIVGGGVIGVEFASVFSRLGTKVTIVEMLDEILPFMDADLAKKMRTCMTDIDFRLGCAVQSVEGSTVVYAKDGAEDRVEAEVILMAVGRRPLVDGWGADAIGLDHGPKGVSVDDCMHTSLPHVWAVGDVTGRSLLAHAAYRMGEIAAALILDPTSQDRGQRMRWDTVPWAVYSSPEAAGVGLTEKEATRRGLDVISASAPLVLSGRFVAENGLSRAGLVKVIAERESHVIRGIHMFGPYAPETIWGAAAVLEMELSVEDLRQVVFPPPTVSEGIREAVWALDIK
ncbi:MAG: dihydrolipoyl dehydrogenase [Propionibacteriaceae bacterium]|jgi:dihydrolipoamide dehydrogenase|nr:dihydrolipoyl dehydrogenase [Propionibacteriaceae bacterium]